MRQATVKRYCVNKSIGCRVGSPAGRRLLARAIRELGWNDESIADAAHIAEHTGLVTAARNGKLIEVSQQQQIPLYRLIAFLGLSKEMVLNSAGK